MTSPGAHSPPGDQACTTVAYPLPAQSACKLLQDAHTQAEHVWAQRTDMLPALPIARTYQAISGHRSMEGIGSCVNLLRGVCKSPASRLQVAPLPPSSSLSFLLIPSPPGPRLPSDSEHPTRTHVLYLSKYPFNGWPFSSIQLALDAVYRLLNARVHGGY